MTHTLHREGTIEELGKDFVVLAMPTAGVTTKGSGPKLKRFLELACKYNPINLGDSKKGTVFNMEDAKELIEKVSDGGVCHAVYGDKNSVLGLLKELKKEDLGLNVTVSGLFDIVDEILEKIELEPHTINMSLGIHGNVERLPEEQVRKITTMCGHGMITSKYVYKLIDDIEKGLSTPQKAANEMAQLCVCGIFNTKRAEKILSDLAIG